MDEIVRFQNGTPVKPGDVVLSLDGPMVVYEIKIDDNGWTLYGHAGYIIEQGNWEYDDRATSLFENEEAGFFDYDGMEVFLNGVVCANGQHFNVDPSLTFWRQWHDLMTFIDIIRYQLTVDDLEFNRLDLNVIEAMAARLAAFVPSCAERP